nr:(+)-neomenthol dehydrogenase-like isoform X2 [Ipomoea batatas]
METARQLAASGVTVVLTARNEKRGTEAVSLLHNEGLSNVVFHRLDVVDKHSIECLVNNAGASGVVVDEDALRALNLDPADWEERIDETLQKFLRDLKEGALEANGWQPMLPAYSISKATLNAYTRLLAKKNPSICINCVHPGYVNTDLNWHTGPLTVEEGAQGPVMLALLPQGGPSGHYFDQTVMAEF